MRLRRYFPLLGAVAFVAVCVFLGRSDKLASYAGGTASGCGGSSGVAQDLSALGTADDQSKTSVAELAQFPIVGTEAQLQDDAATIARLEDALTTDIVGAAPAVAEQFQEAGCYSPGSARIAKLIGEIAVRDTISPTQRQVFVNVLLNTAGFSAAQATPDFQLKQNSIPGSRLHIRPEIVANDRLTPAFEQIRTAISENNGVAIGDTIHAISESEAPQLNSEKLGQFNQQTCAIQAFEAVAAITKFEIEAPEKTAYRLLDSLDVLQPMDKGAYRLVEALASVAPAIQPWDAHFVAIAMNKNYDDDTRGFACKNAATRGNDLSAIRKIAQDVQLPAQIAGCLLTYQKEGPSTSPNNGQNIGASATNLSLDSQIEVIRNTQVTVDQTLAITNLQNLFDPTKLTYFSNIGTLQAVDFTNQTTSLRGLFARADIVAQEFAQLPKESRTSFLDELSTLEQVSPNHQSFGLQLRNYMARRSGAAVAAADVDAIQRQDDPQVVDTPNSKREIDLSKAAKEIQQNNNGNGINTLNPVQKPTKEKAAEVNNGAPIQVPGLGK